MIRTLFTAISIFTSILSINAQSFMDRIEQSSEGEGTIRIFQDSLMTRIVNGEYIPVENTEDLDNKTRIKRRGYRIQVFKGGSTRADEAAARSMGEKIKKTFKISAYTIYNSPEWVCRVGDFKNRDEALEHLKNIRNVSRSAMIVPSEIYVKE